MITRRPCCIYHVDVVNLDIKNVVHIISFESIGLFIASSIHYASARAVSSRAALAGYHCLPKRRGTSRIVHPCPYEM